jgi:hypothetical protein
LETQVGPPPCDRAAPLNQTFTALPDYSPTMFFRSLFYERTILSHLERVERLQTEVQAEIAMRVGNLIEMAKPVGDALLERFAEIVRQEQLLAVKEGAKSDTDPLWAAPAISEAWCNAQLGLAKGNLDRHSAVAIIAAVESFAKKKASDRRHSRT